AGAAEHDHPISRSIEDRAVVRARRWCRSRRCEGRPEVWRFEREAPDVAEFVVFLPRVHDHALARCIHDRGVVVTVLWRGGADLAPDESRQIQSPYFPERAEGRFLATVEESPISSGVVDERLLQVIGQRAAARRKLSPGRTAGESERPRGVTEARR